MTPLVVFDFEGIAGTFVVSYRLSIAHDEVDDLTFVFPMVLVVDIVVDIVLKEAVIHLASPPPWIVSVKSLVHEWQPMPTMVNYQGEVTHDEVKPFVQVQIVVGNAF